MHTLGQLRAEHHDGDRPIVPYITRTVDEERGKLGMRFHEMVPSDRGPAGTTFSLTAWLTDEYAARAPTDGRRRGLSPGAAQAWLEVEPLISAIGDRLHEAVMPEAPVGAADQSVTPHSRIRNVYSLCVTNDAPAGSFSHSRTCALHRL